MSRIFFKSNAFLINVALLCLVLALSILRLNRAFIIGAITGVVFLLFAYKKIRLSKLAIVGYGLTMLILAFGLAVYVKSDSSLGRMLIYKVSWKIFLDHPLIGIGWGNFQHDYGLYQAEYFKQGNFTQKEFLLAGNTFYAFNDYWEFVIETGLIGACCLLLSIYLLIKLVKVRLQKKGVNHIIRLFAALLLVICIAALFTHVFGHGLFKIVLFFLIVCVVQPRSTSIGNLLVVALTIFFSLAIYGFEIRNMNRYRKLEETKVLLATGYVLEGQRLFAELYPSLKSDIGFLKDYNDALTGQRNSPKKIQLLKEITSRYTDNLSYLKLADVYARMGMRKEAEVAYLQSVNIVPNRFTPKEALLNFYLKNKQYEQASYWKNVILTMPIKIPSEKTEAIRQNVKNKSININP